MEIPKSVSATLQVELVRAAYLNAFALAPFSVFPATLTRVETQGLTGDSRTTLFSGSALVDRPLTLRFSRQLVRTLYLTFRQENYTLKQHQQPAPDQLRRDVLAGLQD